MKVIYALVLLSSLIGAQLNAQNTPEAAADAFGKAFATGDYAGAARLMHPAALRQFRDLFSLVLTNENMATARQKMFGFSTSADANAAPDTVLFANMIKGLVQGQPGFAEAMKAALVMPLGHVQVGDTAMVITRFSLKARGIPITQFDVMPFMRDGTVWRGMLKADITNMAAAMKGFVSPVGG